MSTILVLEVTKNVVALGFACVGLKVVVIGRVGVDLIDKGFGYCSYLSAERR